MKTIISHLLTTGTCLFVMLSCDKNNPVYDKNKPITETNESRGKLVFVTIDSKVGPPGVYSMKLDGSDLKPIAVEGDTVYFPGPWGNYYVIGKTSQPSVVSSPRWSPDGKTIVCTLIWAYEGSALMLMNADGTNKRVLWKVRDAAQRPQWSPEGNKILFMRSGYLGVVYAVGIVDSSGNNDRDYIFFEKELRFLHEGDTVWIYIESNFQWSPFGNLIYGLGSVNKKPDSTYILGNNPQNEIFSFDSYTGRLLQRLTRNHLDEGGFRLSPNGQYFAFKRGDYGRPNTFFIFAFADSSAREIPVQAYVDFFWNWSSDNKKIIFAKDENPDPYRNDDLYLYMIDLERQNELKKLTSFQAREPDLFIY